MSEFQKKNDLEYFIDRLGDNRAKVVLSFKDGMCARLSWNFETSSEKGWIKWTSQDVGTVLSSRIKFTDGEVRYEKSERTEAIYPELDGRLEWAIRLSEKPPTNTFFWLLEYHQDIKIGKQGSLEEDYQRNNSGYKTLQDYLANHIRPDDVVESYVFYSSARGDIKDANGDYTQKAGTGKLCIFYRPIARDKTGKWVWCDLDINTSLYPSPMTVTVPQDFLDTAVYPIEIDPDVGNTSCGSSSNSHHNTVTAYLEQNVPAGTWSDVGACGHEIGVGAGNLYASIYEDAGGGADSQLLAEASIAYAQDENDCGGTGNTAAYDPESGDPDGAKDFWIAVSSSSWALYVCYDSPGGNQGKKYDANNDHPTSNDWSADADTTALCSVWATYTTAGGIERNIAGSLPAMAGALARKHYAKRDILGAI